MKDQHLIELVNILYDVIDKQNSIISELSAVVKQQNLDLQHYKSVNGFFDDMDMSGIDEKIKEYNEMMSNI